MHVRLRPGVGTRSTMNERLDRARRPRAASLQCRVPKASSDRVRLCAMENAASDCLCRVVGRAGLARLEGARCRRTLRRAKPRTAPMVRGSAKRQGAVLLGCRRKRSQRRRLGNQGWTLPCAHRQRMGRRARRGGDHGAQSNRPYHGLADPGLSRRVDPLLHAGIDDVDPAQDQRRASRIFLVTLQKFDRDALRPADKADAYARPDGRWLFGELDALGPDLGRDGVDVLYREAEMIESLVRGGGRRVDTVARLDLCNEHLGPTELHVNATGPSDDFAPEDALEPGRRRLWIGATQMNMIPGDARHFGPPNVVSSAAMLAAEIGCGHPLEATVGWLPSNCRVCMEP